MLGGLLFIRLAARQPGTTAAGRLAGWLLAALPGLGHDAPGRPCWSPPGSGRLADQPGRPPGQHPPPPNGAFTRYLADADPDSTERVAQYALALLVPAAGTLAVLALAAVDAGRSLGLRLIGGFACVAVIGLSMVR